MTKIEQNYQLTHLVSPILPAAWHEQIRQFLDDIASISAIFEVEILMHIVEKKDGNLLASACMPDDVSNEVQAFASLACAREQSLLRGAARRRTEGKSRRRKDPPARFCGGVFGRVLPK
jgi:hypothetical protein